MIKNSDTSYKSKKDVKTKDGDTITMYEYSENHLKKRDEKKADKVNHLQTEMDNIVKDAKKKLNSKDSKEQMTALAVLLIDHTYERVGNERSADEGHHGVTTWEVDHLSFKDGKAVLKYVGKSGVDHTKEVTDKTLISALKDLKSKSKSGFLFQNDDASVRASDVNDYLKDFDITAKDIRGYHANRLVQEKLKKISPAKDEDKKKQLLQNARELAVKEAKSKAESLARAAGLTLGKIVNVQESFGSVPVPMYAKSAIGLGGGREDTQIQPGSTDISTSVTLFYETR